MEKLELRLDPVNFLGAHDEANFFAWLESVPGYCDFRGRGEEMRAYFDPVEFTPFSFIELVRLALRYRLDRSRLVPFLQALPESDKAEYLKDGSAWHEALFGPDG
jgi:hypothetical protein